MKHTLLSSLRGATETKIIIGAQIGSEERHFLRLRWWLEIYCKTNAGSGQQYNGECKINPNNPSKLVGCDSLAVKALDYQLDSLNPMSTKMPLHNPVV